MKVSQLNREPPEFQQPVDEALLRQQLANELADDILEVTELQSGMFNNTYRVTAANSKYILKVSPNAKADVFYNERCLMQREETVSKQLQASSSLVPKYISFFTIGERQAFLQAFVEGELWHDVEANLTQHENDILWHQLGEFAHGIHACKGELFGYPAPGEQFDCWSGFIMDNVAGMVGDAERLGLMCKEIETFVSLLPGFKCQLDEFEIPCLCHGDLWSRNVIIDGAGDDIHIKAVIDGERAFWGDPVSDWVLILYGVPSNFWEGYGGDLVKISSQTRVAIYKGMYFLLNMLETSRFNSNIAKPTGWLAAINEELTNAIHEPAS